MKFIAHIHITNIFKHRELFPVIKYTTFNYFIFSKSLGGEFISSYLMLHAPFHYESVYVWAISDISTYGAKLMKGGIFLD